MLKKHGMERCESLGTPLATKPKLDADLSGTPVDQTKYQSMIGSLMYLTSSRLDIMQAGTINMGLRYPKDSGFELTAFSDDDHVGCIDTRKSTSRGISTDIKEMDIIKTKKTKLNTRMKECTRARKYQDMVNKKASDTLGSHAGNPQQSHWLKNVSRDPTAKRLRIEGSYEWRVEIRGLRSVSGSRIISTSL
ncbi:hypothetical protein Tco_1271912 [Tanacetum coccineum]